jgi:hypothetical protein
MATGGGGGTSRIRRGKRKRERERERESLFRPLARDAMKRANEMEIKRAKREPCVVAWVGRGGVGRRRMGEYGPRGAEVHVGRLEMIAEQTLGVGRVGVVALHALAPPPVALLEHVAGLRIWEHGENTELLLPLLLLLLL